ncbi:XRE family transcriptional regulator [Sphingomonas crocodyli]|uniref:XRE family transcriptional regulator n=2 Tax=Sphingomonas crocodyli TaxID=1979270 RepID=A0A437M7F6_9SPHN|nr:XRE family transcriptional regulator [Sphingomonas crocodyli]
MPQQPSSDPSVAEMEQLLSRLRRMLRGAGWTQAALAIELGVGPATIKRWLHGRGLSVQMLGRLCALAHTSLAELADDCGNRSQGQDDLTLAQEEALTRDANLSTIFFLIVNGWPLSEATEGFRIPADEADRHVERLERLALIDRLPGGRVRARLRPDHKWQRAPMRRHFDQHLKPLFFSMDYGDPEAMFGAETQKLSPTGVARLRELIETFRGDVRAIAMEDRRTATLPGQWYAVLAVARTLWPKRR